MYSRIAIDNSPYLILIVNLPNSYLNYLCFRKYRHDLYENIGMVNENGEKWKMLRKHLSPPLTNRKTAQHYAADMNEIADELVDIVSKNSQKLEQDTEGQFLFLSKHSMLSVVSI